MTSKYFKPRSVTWWGGAIPIAAGLLIAFLPVTGAAEVAKAISTLFGDAPPAVLINGGLITIGLRGAVGQAGVLE